MKQFGIIFILLFLGTNIKIYACFDNEDDWLDGGMLPDVEIYPDNSDWDDDDWGDDDWGDDDWDDDNWDDDNWDDWDDDNWDYSGTFSVYGDNQQSQGYMIKNGDMVVKNLPSSWEKQDNPKNCVTTAMEYIAYLLNLGILREGFEYDYKYVVSDDQRDVKIEGILKSDLERFINYEFDANKVSAPLVINSFLTMGFPILLDIDGTSNGAFSLCGHEVVIIGYTANNGSNYIYVDPSDGNYHTKNYWSFPINTTAYAIKGRKN